MNSAGGRSRRPLPLPAVEPNKGSLTSTSSGRAAFEHPASPSSSASRHARKWAQGGSSPQQGAFARRRASGGRCPWTTRPVAREVFVSCAGTVAVLANALRADGGQPREPAAAHALPPCPPAEGHATSARRESTESPSQQRRVAGRRLFGRNLAVSRRKGRTVQRSSARPLVAPTCFARVAPQAGRARACLQEIGQCPTKCSSMRPTRRRPG